MTERVLVTGGAGFIGGEVVAALAGRYDVTVLDSLSPQIHGDDPDASPLYRRVLGQCRFIRGQVEDVPVLREALEGVSYVIHLAAETGTGQSMYEVGRYARTNIQGTAELIELLTKHRAELPVKKVVLSSSRSIYGEGMYRCAEHGVVYPGPRSEDDLAAAFFEVRCPVCGSTAEVVPTTEECVPSPASFYAWSKLAQEQMLRLLLPPLGIPFTIFRYQNVYGAGQSLNNPYTGILSIFSKRMVAGLPINVFEDGAESRDFVHVRDVARLTASVLDSPASDGATLNVGSGVGVSVLEVADMLRRLYDSMSEVSVSGDFRIGDIRHNVADVTRAQDLCGFRPEVSLEVGLRELAAWAAQEIRDGAAGDDRYEASLAEMRQMGLMKDGRA
jgi:dTDP-L-rhamnose 4-epimerase